MIVFKRGTWIGLKATTPIGGHEIPSSMTGVSLLWKKAQKKGEEKYNLRNNKQDYSYS